MWSRGNQTWCRPWRKPQKYTQLGGNKLLLWEGMPLGELTLRGIDSGELAYLTASMHPSIPHERTWGYEEGHHTLKTCRILPPKLLTSTSPVIISAGICHAQILHAPILRDGRMWQPANSTWKKKSHRSVLVTQSQPWALSFPSNCHRIPTLPWERGTGLVAGASTETSSVWTEGKIPSYWDAPRHHCQYKHHYLEMTLAQLF